ncbi:MULTISPECIES: DNA primase [Rhodopirellula]|mgnify:CR=1 FL=1|uniref:DNA primase n=1 Tax=Rhodopirellula TaxID=265488 RepID=UPI00257AC3F8|nr:DNA primase [Rhodopirellula sp. UBA1907]|tara:strand:+ start:177 stop:1148 length:972 start_codon:yes stop_codon:yes gene_type:complete
MSCDHTLGFRIEGGCSNQRKLVDYDRAFLAYASCDPLAKVEFEGFLSPFQYDEAIRCRCQDAGLQLDVCGFDGRCWSAFVWFDIDRENNVAAATQDARRMAASLLQRYGLNDEELLLFFSGSKGYHIGLPTSLFEPRADKQFNRSCRMLAEELAKVAEVAIDMSIYSKVQPLRAPNSRHGKTGLHKRFLAFDELLNLKPEKVLGLAEEPMEFDLPLHPKPHELACEDWDLACRMATEWANETVVWDEHRSELNQLTVDFIRDGAVEGERHTRLYSAAANLGEFEFTERQAGVVLGPSALDSGLSQREIDRTIQNAINPKGNSK